MTIQGAMNELVNLLNADDIPIYYKGVIKKVIETIDDYIDGKDDYINHKIEPSNSEIPNNSTSSKMEQVDKPQTELVRVKYHCINCAENGSYKCSKCDGEMYYKYDKDEPQTYVINPQEPTNDDKCFECDDFFTCGGQCNKIEDEPQTDCAWR